MCSLTQGYTIGCKGIGGISEAYLIDHNDVDSITVVDGVITEIVLSGLMWKYELQRGTSTFSNKVERQNSGAKVYNIDFSMVLNTMQTTVRNEVRRVIRKNLTVIVKDRNGVYWMLGKENGIKHTQGKVGPGQAGTDRIGFELNFEGSEKQPVYEVSSAAMDDLIGVTEYYILTETGDFILQETGDKILVE